MAARPRRTRQRKNSPTIKEMGQKATVLGLFFFDLALLFGQLDHGPGDGSRAARTGMAIFDGWRVDVGGVGADREVFIRASATLADGRTQVARQATKARERT